MIWSARGQRRAESLQFNAEGSTRSKNPARLRWTHASWLQMLSASGRGKTGPMMDFLRFASGRRLHAAERSRLATAFGRCAPPSRTSWWSFLESWRGGSVSSHRAGSLCHSAAVPSDERREVGRRNSDRVQDADVRQFAARAEAVDRRGAHAEAARDLADAEQIFLDPSWTQRFVFLRCGMGNSGIRL